MVKPFNGESNYPRAGPRVKKKCDPPHLKWEVRPNPAGRGARSENEPLVESVLFVYSDFSGYFWSLRASEYPERARVATFSASWLQLKQNMDQLEERVRTRTSNLEGANRRLQSEIEERKRVQAEREKLIEELQQDNAEVNAVSGFLPVCSSCKKIRDDQGGWQRLEPYIQDRSQPQFSHRIGPDCRRELYPD